MSDSAREKSAGASGAVLDLRGAPGAIGRPPSLDRRVAISFGNPR
jgi:hypothetical protein